MAVMTTALDDLAALVDEGLKRGVISRRRLVKSSLQFRAGGRGEYTALRDAGEILGRQIGEGFSEGAQVCIIDVQR